jgi:hypothetical protein
LGARPLSVGRGCSLSAPVVAENTAPPSSQRIHPSLPPDLERYKSRSPRRRRLDGWKLISR